ncbi:MAG: hypothetical protein H0V17_25650 [Deltaproteobacteria bacterium]|nr:hypothetical protein [Deltaproteobacteria bacterium]
MTKSVLVAIALSTTACAVGIDNSQNRLRTAIDSQRSSLHRCYSQALLNDADMEGVMRLLVRVPHHAERIDSVEPSGESQLTNTNLHGPLHRCVQRALVGLQIGAAPIHDDLYVEYAFQFAPEGSDIAPVATGPQRPSAGVSGNVRVDVDTRGVLKGKARGNVDLNVGIDAQ